MKGMTPDETASYVRHHLEQAGRTAELFTDDAVRHEAPSDRVEVKGLRRLAVAAAGLKPRAA
jgi:type II secretory pathway predicted ATPase ExeA